VTISERWAITPARFRWLALVDFVATIVIVLTGAAVRLSGSGLGCPDWPTCFRGQLTGPIGLHSAIEYGNRVVTGGLIVVVGLSVIAAWLRTPRRRDLLVLSGGLVGGIVGDAVLGAFVVYSHLNPWLVALHLVLSLAMVALAATLYHRSKYRYDEGASAEVRDPGFKRAARWLWVPFVGTVLAGTVATGSGPHAGGQSGQTVARRLPIAFNDAVWIHSVAATLFVGIVIGLLAATWWSSAPLPLRTGVRRLAVIALIQAAIGATQYWLHVPVLLVELHVAGAVSLTIGVVQLNVRQVSREREPGTRKMTPTARSAPLAG
jgi:cytochrome c oxidase assembly protein subunit 15